MTDSLQNEHLARRDLLVAGLGLLLSLAGFADPALAQRRRRRRLQRRRRAVTRRALRRFRRRGGGLEERARTAVRKGEIRRLREVYRVVRQRSGSEVIDVDLHQRAGGWVYALRVVTPRGRVRDVFLDARTLKILHLSVAADGFDGVPLPRQLELPPNPASKLPTEQVPLPPRPRRGLE